MRKATAVAAIALAAYAVTACGSSSTVARDTGSRDSSTTSTIVESASGTSATAAGERSPTDEGSGDLGPLVRCPDIPELTATVEGSLPRFANPEDEVAGVLLTYGLEHPDTYAGFWTDRSKGGTLVLAFTDDPAPHLEAILARGPSPDDFEVVSPMPPIRDPRPLGERDDVAVDVVQATFTEAELLAASERFWSDRPPPYVLGGWIDTQRNRIALDLIDPTAGQLADLADRVPLDMTCVNVTITNETTPPAAPLDDLQVIVAPDSKGRLPPDAELQCNDSVRFPASALDDMPLLADAGIEAAMSSFLDTGEGGFWPQDQWRLLHQADDEAIVVHAEPGESGVSIMTLERTGDQWQLGVIQSGPCLLRTPLPTGMNTVEWRLDPAAPAPTPDSTAIELLLSEVECTSGQAIGDRLVGPDVAVTDDAVLIAFAATPPPGDAHTCPGNPEQAIMVELPQALGDRTVIDGLSVVGDLADFLGTESATTTTSTTAGTTTDATDGDAVGALGEQPTVIDRMVSPSWVAEFEDFEDVPSLIESVQGGGEAPQVSDAMTRIMTAGLPDGQGLPYYYRAEPAEGPVIAEKVHTRLDNGDSLSVGWRFRWADTPPCEICTENQVLWDNGWQVWTDADPERGTIRLLAEHPARPFNVEITLFPDPLQWPEALPENDPILLTSPQEAEASAAAILDAVQTTISIPTE